MPEAAELGHTEQENDTDFGVYLLTPEEIISKSFPYRKSSPPSTSGIYFLSGNGVILYIGKSNSIAARLASHRQAGTPYKVKWDCFWIEVPDEYLDEIETVYIQAWEPVLNADYKFRSGVRAEIRQLYEPLKAISPPKYMLCLSGPRREASWELV